MFFRKQKKDKRYYQQKFIGEVVFLTASPMLGVSSQEATEIAQNIIMENYRSVLARLGVWG